MSASGETGCYDDGTDSTDLVLRARPPTPLDRLGGGVSRTCRVHARYAGHLRGVLPCGERESYRDCRRAHSLRGWSPCHDRVDIPPKSESGPSGWSGSTAPSTRPSGPRSRRLPAGMHVGDAAALGPPGRAGRRPEGGPHDGRTATAEGSWSARIASSNGPMKF